jgi:hypothetical protein
MPDWSWKTAIASCVLEIVNRKGSPEFTLAEVYGYTERISSLFPRNTRVRQKIRQVLQRLRDDEGFLLFSEKGHYVLDLGYEEIDGEQAVLGDRGFLCPRTRRTVRNIRLRDTFLAREIKRRYGNTCQVCRQPLRLSANDCYSEGHHLKPLGSPHCGPDVAGNILVLCPNHHLLFDRAAITIVPESLVVVHRIEGVIPRDTRVQLKPWHILKREFLEYHHRRFLDACGA